MKKIILTICLLFMAQTFVVADEIIDEKGNVIPCKIETVCNGFIEYRKDGNLYSFAREMKQAVYNDYVDVIDNALKRDVTTRYSGVIVFKDSMGVKINTNDGYIQIPWYKLKFVGLFKPE